MMRNDFYPETIPPFILTIKNGDISIETKLRIPLLLENKKFKPKKITVIYNGGCTEEMRQKYLKYKAKYLALKELINKTISK
jgi:hypothetical protein